MKIGAVAEALGIDTATIRFYESQKVVPPPQRSDNGYRSYSDEDVTRLRFIVLGRTLGLPLGDLREILALRDRGEAPCSYVRSVIDRQATAISQRIADLQLMAKELERLQVVAQSLPDTPAKDGQICHILAT